VIRPESLKKPPRLNLQYEGAVHAAAPTAAEPGGRAAGLTSPLETLTAPPADEPTSKTSESARTPSPSKTSPGVNAPEMGVPEKSPGYEYYQKVIGSGLGENGGRNGFVSPSARSVQVPKLTKPGYVVSPSLDELARLSDADLAAVDGFAVTRPGYGSIHWQGAVDVRGADLDKIIDISKSDIAVYAEEEKTNSKPPEGSKLNRPALLTFFEIFPKNRDDPEDVEKVRRKLEKSAKKSGATFVSYDSNIGTI